MNKKYITPQNNVIKSKCRMAATTFMPTKAMKNKNDGAKGQLTPSIMIPTRTVAIKKLNPNENHFAMFSWRS